MRAGILKVDIKISYQRQRVKDKPKNYNNCKYACDDVIRDWVADKIFINTPSQTHTTPEIMEQFDMSESRQTNEKQTIIWVLVSKLHSNYMCASICTT